MEAVAVDVVSPLTTEMLACQGPLGRSLGGPKVRFPDWPGARVMICCAGKGPAEVLPGPPVRRAVPFRSTARPPVFSTWATMDGQPAADRRAVMDVMAKFVGGAPPRPTARYTRIPTRVTSLTPNPLAACT